VGDDPAAQPGLVDLEPDRVHHARDLAPGDRGQLRQCQRPHRTPRAQRGVDQVHAGHRHGDPRLPGTGPRVLDVLVAQALGRSEGVQADGVHGAPRYARPPRATTGNWT
jgi:hypothetical protein